MKCTANFCDVEVRPGVQFCWRCQMLKDEIESRRTPGPAELAWRESLKTLVESAAVERIIVVPSIEPWESSADLPEAERYL